MKLTKIRLGDYIKEYKKNCNIENLSIYDVSGIDSKKDFFEPTKQVGADTKKYKIVPHNYFACNLMHVGRDYVLPVSLNLSKKNKIVSPAYTVFHLKENNKILTEFLFILFKCSEFDRLLWFHTDSSIRCNLDWEVFCNIKIDLPDIDIQRKYVNIYKSLVENQKAYEKGLDDLKLTCDAYIEDLRSKYPCEKIGPYIEEIDERNTDNSNKNVMGLSTTKRLREVTSKVNKEELSKYKILDKNTFAYVLNTDTWKVFAYALNTTNNQVVVSQVYKTFKINRFENIIPEYLSLWFNRTEFDRYARYHSWGTAREVFSFDDLCKVKIPIPDIKIQESIVNVYNAYIKRKEINEKLKAQIKDICPILIRGAVEEAQRS